MFIATIAATSFRHNGVHLSTVGVHKPSSNINSQSALHYHFKGVFMQNGQVTGQKERGFESKQREVEQAFKGLEDAVSHIKDAFAPAIGCERPVGTGTGNDKLSQTPSAYASAMDQIVNRIKEYAGQLHEIANRSEI
jgi:hypothetical protein